MRPGYDHIMTGGWAVEVLLTEPRPVLEVDLNEIDELFRTPSRDVAVGDIVRYSLQLDDLLAPATWLTPFE